MFTRFFLFSGVLSLPFAPGFGLGFRVIASHRTKSLFVFSSELLNSLVQGFG